MMKRRLSYLWSAAVLSILLAVSCTDDSFTGSLPQEFYTTSPIAVTASVGSVDGGLTKTGAITGLEMLYGKAVTVFAPRVENGYSYADPSNSVVTFQNAYISADDFFLRWEGEQRYYPNRERHKEKFDFFAWYLDGAQTSAMSIGEDYVDIPVGVDGTKDVMYSKAEVASDLAIMKENAFSYYTAQRNLVPLFRMSHALTCLDFEIKPGVNEESVHKLTVRSVKMRIPSNLVIRVAARDASSLGLYSPSPSQTRMLALRESDGSELDRDKYVIVTRSSESQPASSVTIGGDFLIPAVYSASSTLSVQVKDSKYEDEYTTSVNISHHPACCRDTATKWCSRCTVAWKYPPAWTSWAGTMPET